jgi:hypothetical protein
LSEESVFSGVGAGCEGAVGGGDGAGVDEVTGDCAARASRVLGGVRVEFGNREFRISRVV